MLGRTAPAPVPATDRRAAAVAALALAAALLAALLPGMARVPSQLEAPTGPLAAPAPVLDVVQLTQ